MDFESVCSSLVDHVFEEFAIKYGRQPTANEFDCNILKQMKSCTGLQGPHFERDSRHIKFWQCVRQRESVLRDVMS